MKRVLNVFWERVREFERPVSELSLGSGSPIVTMMQPTQSIMRKHVSRGYGGASTVWCSFPESKMRAVFVVQVNNTTPIISNRKKSITPGTLGAAVLWQFTKRSPGMVGSCLSAASKKTQKHDTWRSRNGCSIQPSAAACNWRPHPQSVVKHCWI